MRRAALLLVPAFLLAPPALACINGMKDVDLGRLDQSPVARARAAHREGRYAEAVSISGEALKTAPKGVDRRFLLRMHGLSSLKLGHFKDAASSLTELSRETKEPFVKAKLAETALRSAEAEGTLDEAARGVLEKLGTEGLLADADAWAALAKARVRAGDRPGALQACEEALRTQAGHPEAAQLKAQLQPPAPATPAKAGPKS